MLKKNIDKKWKKTKLPEIAYNGEKILICVRKQICQKMEQNKVARNGTQENYFITSGTTPPTL